MKNRRIAIEAYNRFGHHIDGKFIKATFSGLGVSDEDTQILLLASNLREDPTSYPSSSEEFDIDRKFLMVSNRVKYVLDSIGRKTIPEIFKDGDKLTTKFGDAENANLVAIGLVIETVSSAQEFVKQNRVSGITFDNEDQKEFKKLLKDVKGRYRL